MREEYTAVRVEGDSAEMNPREFSDWMLEPAASGGASGDKAAGARIVQVAETSMDRRLGALSNVTLHPENRELVSAAWVEPNAAPAADDQEAARSSEE